MRTICMCIALYSRPCADTHPCTYSRLQTKDLVCSVTANGLGSASSGTYSRLQTKDFIINASCYLDMINPRPQTKDFLVDEDGFKCPVIWFDMIHPNAGFNPAKDCQCKLQMSIQVGYAP